MIDPSEISIQMPGNKNMFFAADGESFEMNKHENSLSIRVLPTTLKFVVPSGVALKEQCREGE